MKVFAHRGSSLLWPENTLLAFGGAHAAGVSGFETDLRLSADGEIVLCHDERLDRLGLPGVVVAERTAAELVGLEAVSPDGKLRDRVITLRTLLEAYPDKSYIFDCKISEPRLFRATQELLGELGFHERVWFLAWSRRAEELIDLRWPGGRCFPTYQRSVVWGLASAAGLGRLFEPANRILSLPAYYHGLPVLRPAQAADIRRRGKTLMGYLANTPQDFARCQACGVDAILTDRADRFGSADTSGGSVAGRERR